jgi:hypothetical protein
MTTLDRIPRMQFEAELVRHFFAFYPRDCRLAGEAQVHEIVQLGIERAMAHGYRARNAVGLYINLMFSLGSRFDEDPQIPWARQQLGDDSVEEPLERMQRLFRTTEEYLIKTAGNDEELLREALRRITPGYFREPPEGDGAAFAKQAWARVSALYPQKAGVQGMEPTLALIASSIESAARRGIRSASGRYVYITNAFLWGIGFDTDPLYPWARRALATEAIGGEAARVERLIRESLGRIERSLEG